MDEGPLVSIVIPCYNAEKYVGEAIESALGQTYPRIEVIVVDDGSTDRSLDVIKGFGDRIRWVTGPNRGGSAARNRGIELARGEYLQFLDADDVIMPNKVRACYREFEEGVDLVFCGMDSFSDPECDRRMEPEQRKFSPAQRLVRRVAALFRKDLSSSWDPENPLRYMLSHPIGTPQPLHRTETLRKTGGFREDLDCGQEFEFHWRMALSGLRFKKIDAVLARFRKHDSPDRIGNMERLATRRLDIISMAYENTEKAGKLDQSLMRAFATDFIKRGRKVYHTEDRKAARSAFAKARELHRFHRSGQGIIYDFLSWAIGLERTEKLFMRVKRKLG